MFSSALHDARLTPVGTRLIYLSALAILLSFLVGCSYRTDLTVHADEKWEYISTIDIDPAYEEDGGAVDAAMQEALAERKAQVGAEQLEFEYDREVLEDKVRYTIKMSGQGYDLLVSQLSDSALRPEFTVNPDGTVQIEVPTSGNDSIFPIRHEFHLHAGRIIESNAPTVEGGTAIWTSAEISARDINTISALVEPVGNSGFNIFLLAGAIVAALAVAGGLLAYLMRQQRRPSAPEPIEPQW